MTKHNYHIPDVEEPITVYRLFGMTNAYHDANGKWVRLLTAERLIAYNA